jgi:hypothetical protein
MVPMVGLGVGVGGWVEETTSTDGTVVTGVVDGGGVASPPLPLVTTSTEASRAASPNITIVAASSTTWPRLNRDRLTGAAGVGR